MGILATAVFLDVVVTAPGFFEGIAKDRHPVKSSCLVDGPGDIDDFRGQPFGIDGDIREERFAKDTANEPISGPIDK